MVGEQASRERFRRFLQSRGGYNTRIVWRGAKYLTAGCMLLLYPLVFWLDDRVDVSFSPILPALVALILLWIFVPMLLAEIVHGAWRRLEDDQQNRRAARWLLGTRRVFIVSALFVLAWVVFIL